MLQFSANNQTHLLESVGTYELADFKIARDLAHICNLRQVRKRNKRGPSKI